MQSLISSQEQKKLLQIFNLNFRRGNFYLSLNDQEFSSSEIILVEGQSGTGKSTFFDLLCGFEQPSSGDIVWQGSSLANKAPQDRPISIQLQGNSLFSGLSVEKNLLLAMHDFPMRRSEKSIKVHALIHSLKLPATVLAKKPSALSGGELLRANIARALLRRKPILILDEPFASLDATTAAAVAKYIEEYTRKYSILTFVSDHGDIAKKYLSITKYTQFMLPLRS